MVQTPCATSARTSCGAGASPSRRRSRSRWRTCASAAPSPSNHSPPAPAGPWRDTYAASRLLLDEVVRRCPVRGEPVVLVPHRDLLLITGSDDEDGLSRVASMSLDALLAPRALDGRALRLTSGTWVPFMPERLSNAWKDFRQLELFSRARDYDEQTRQLDKHYQDTGEDVFVAAFTPYQDEHGRSLSYAVWQKGMTTLLPRADLIFFVDPDQGERAPPWESRGGRTWRR
ncbi:hypothetical protein ACN28S_53400 [Cystobacter fuscus]